MPKNQKNLGLFFIIICLVFFLYGVIVLYNPNVPDLEKLNIKTLMPFFIGGFAGLVGIMYLGLAIEAPTWLLKRWVIRLIFLILFFILFIYWFLM
jgi:hypothetical protein